MSDSAGFFALAMLVIGFLMVFFNHRHLTVRITGALLVLSMVALLLADDWLHHSPYR